MSLKIMDWKNIDFVVPDFLMMAVKFIGQGYKKRLKCLNI